MATDRRTKYTKAVIREALFTLLEEKPLQKISVTDICKLADINRSTFYTYYEDVHTLITVIQNEVLEDAQLSLTTENWFDDLLQLVDRNRDLFRVLIGPHGDANYIRELMYLGYDNSLKAWEKLYPNSTPVMRDYAYAFISNGVTGIMQNWVYSGYSEDMDTIGKLVYGLCSFGMGTLEMNVEDLQTPVGIIPGIGGES